MPAVTSPPRAAQVPHEHTEHGVHRPDPYHWMRDVGSADFLAHLAAERRWYESATGHLSSLAESLRSEMTGRVPPTERSVSTRYQDFYYYTVLPAGREYPQLMRDFYRTAPVTATDSVTNAVISDGSGGGGLVLDHGALRDDSGYLELGVTLVSPDSRLLAYSVDRTGDEVYALRFRDIASGTDLPEEVPGSYYGGAWAADSGHFFYTVLNAAYRPHEVWRHAVGTPVSEDVLVLSEPDERFELNVRASRSGGLVLIWSASRDTTEVWVLDAHDPRDPPRSVGGRRVGVEYHAEHAVLPDGTEVLPGVNVRLGTQRLLIPDLVILNCPGIDTVAYAASDVLLAAEIVSPSTKIQDRVLKRAVYAEAHIPYYLLVEPGEPTAATLFELQGGEYHPIAKSDETDIELTRPFTATIRLA